jgi:predicted ATPase/DNA-binding CsgD family transcriptional regulator
MPTEHEPSGAGLQTYLTRFIGRQEEIASLRQLLDGVFQATEETTRSGSAPARLVTLSGVGGSGKTRLALEVARSFAESGDHSASGFPHGMRLVELAPVASGDQLPQVVASALHLREAASVNPLDAVVKELADQRFLLVIDNCEHLRAACRQLVNVLLPACPGLVILATSRTPLHLAQETIFAVPPLQTIEPDSQRCESNSQKSEAARLFLDRAAMVTPAYTSTSSTAATINRICQRLDGLPLAIELAASWMRVLTAHDLLAEIDRSINFLSSSAPTLAERHRSMRAVLDSSWGRLSPQDQQVFSSLAVFTGSFSRQAAEVVAQASLSSLSALAEKSLIQRLPDSETETRYHLHELVRQYAVERLEESDTAAAEEARRHHLDYFLGLVEGAEEAWDSAAEAGWLNRLRTDQPNVNAALSWALDRQHTEQALRLSAGLFAYWIYTSRLGMIGPILERALSLPWNPASPAAMLARAKALNVAGYAAMNAEDFPRAQSRFDEGLVLYRQLDDDRGVAWALRGRGFVLRVSGDWAASQPDDERSLIICRATGDLRGEAWSVHDLGEIAFAKGDLDRAEWLFEEGLKRFEELGVAFGAYRALYMLGAVHRRRSDWLRSISRYQEALARQRQTHFVAAGADILEGLAMIGAHLRQPAMAARLFGAGEAWRRTFGFGRHSFHVADYERSMTAVEGQLGTTAWSECFDAGQDLTSEQAMDEAHLSAQELATLARSRDVAGLTARETEVLRALALGLSSPEIADRLVVSPRTVHAHLRSIFDKLDVSTRTAAALEAARLNLL